MSIVAKALIAQQTIKGLKDMGTTVRPLSSVHKAQIREARAELMTAMDSMTDAQLAEFAAKRTK